MFNIQVLYSHQAIIIQHLNKALHNLIMQCVNNSHLCVSLSFINSVNIVNIVNMLCMDVCMCINQCEIVVPEQRLNGLSAYLPKCVCEYVRFFLYFINKSLL